MTAYDLIRRALRLINVPGRGALLSEEDTTNGYDALQEIIDNEATSGMFVPGRKLHFFTLTPGKTRYTYGQGAQAELRSDWFEDPMPVRVEQAWSSNGAVITDNDFITEPNFDRVGSWNINGGHYIENNKLVVDGFADTSHGFKLEQGKDYTIRFDVIVITGGVTINVVSSGEQYFSRYITESGSYEYDFNYLSANGSTLDSVRVIGSSGQIAHVHKLSILERTKRRMQIERGSDCEIEVDFSRGYALADIAFPSGVDTVIMEVLTNEAYITNLFSTIKLNPEAMLWLRYYLAHVVSREYSKTLNADQKRIMNDAWSNMAGVNLNIKPMKADSAWSSISRRRR